MTKYTRNSLAVLTCAILSLGHGIGCSADIASPDDSDGASGDGGAGSEDGATSNDDANADSSNTNNSGGSDSPNEGSGSNASSTSGDAPVLTQSSNPIYGQLDDYRSWLSSVGDEETRLAADSEFADNILSWQMPHGGFFKNDRSVYTEAWDGSAERSGWHGADDVELGTIDNNATVTELLFLADVYQRSGDSKYRDGARDALDFLLTMQYPSGGFPQVYPARTGTLYSNYVTFNDNAMVRALILLHQATLEQPPLDGDVFTTGQREDAQSAIDAAVEFILEAQLEQDGVKTVWCAQHDPETYEPKGARSYELPSKSGKESIGVVTFLMTQPQTPEVETAVKAAIAWYDREEVKLENTIYIRRSSASSDDDYNPIQSSPGSTIWCRFYDLDEDVCFFSGRLSTDNPPGEGKQYDIMDIEPERRYGYEWGGNYGVPLFAYAASVGYY